MGETVSLRRRSLIVTAAVFFFGTLLAVPTAVATKILREKVCFFRRLDEEDPGVWEKLSWLRPFVFFAAIVVLLPLWRPYLKGWRFSAHCPRARLKLGNGRCAL